ncbi:MAG: response regulator [Magnetococcales bacterium]|nr:response regulator [Magnetococcales bacterium]
MNIPWPMMHLKIGGRIFAGFGIVVTVLAVQAVLSHLGFNTVVHRFGEYQESNANARAILEIERNALELQRGVILYTYSGYGGVVQRVLRVQRQLDEQLTRARASVPDDDCRDLVRRMEEHFRQYTENFDVAIAERELRDHLMEDRLTSLGDRIGDGLGSILNGAMADGDMHGAALSGLAQEKLLHAQGKAMAFFHQPDSPLVDDVLGQLRQMRYLFTRMRDHFRDNAARLARIDGLIALAPDYEQAFMGMVRASRAYMHLVYVVMGGEAAEFLHLAKELKDRTMEEQSLLEQEIGAHVRNSQFTMIGISLAVVVLSLVLAGHITRAIAMPIKAMTVTLTSLARGRMDAEIPGKGRSDEIGAMAMAAHVFKEKAHELENASQYKSEFLANMSHELRTPLNSLLILARMLANNEEGNLTARQVESARIVHDSGRDLLRLINDILDLSKVEAGRMELLTETRAVTEFGHDIERQFRHVAENKRLGFQVVMATDLPATLATDWGKVEQIVRNFLSNAIKFTDSGRVTVRLARPSRGRVFMNTELKPAHVVGITVEDTGIGIPEDKHAQIFEPFRQVDGSISRKYGGTGLGLAISRKLAELLGGEIQVTSRPGAGAAFTLFLPVQAARETEAVAVAPSSGGDVVAFRDLSRVILVVDDDPRNVFALRQILQPRVKAVLVADNGREALEILDKEETVDLVLMDIMMPVMDGHEAMREIRKRPRCSRLPILALTAKAMSGDRERCLEAGASDYLAKPVETDKLLAALADWLPPLPAREIPDLPGEADSEALSLPPEEAQPEADPLQAVRASGGPLTVMIVDDDMRFVFSLAQTLRRKVDKVLMAPDGARALALLEQHGNGVDVVVLDLMMPHLDGRETLREIRKRGEWSGLPVIIVSARDDQEAREGCLAAGADDYLVKPVAEGALLSRIAAVLATAATRGRAQS